MLTVCITTFNRWPQCFNALQSVRSQMKEGLEIILVDDSSTTPMPEVVERFIDENNIIYIRHSQNLGLASARNTAIKKASNEYFSFCDDDDTWPPDFAKQLLSVIGKAPITIDMVIGQSLVRYALWKSYLDDYPDLKSLIIKGITPPVGSQLYRTSILKKVNGYDPRVKSGVDHDLWISLAGLNPRVGICWGHTAFSNKNRTQARMTNQEDIRKSHICSALEIWKPKLINAFNEEFYEHFIKSYLQLLDTNFFFKNIRNYRYPAASKALLSPYLWQGLIFYFTKRIFKAKTFGALPPFQKKLE